MAPAPDAHSTVLSTLGCPLSALAHLLQNLPNPLPYQGDRTGSAADRLEAQARAEGSGVGAEL